MELATTGSIECVTSLKELCRKEKVTHMFHNNINSEVDNYRGDRIHLSEKGTKILVANIKNHLRKAKTLAGKVKTETSNNRKDNNQNNEMLKKFIEGFLKILFEVMLFGKLNYDYLVIPIFAVLLRILTLVNEFCSILFFKELITTVLSTIFYKQKHEI